MRNLNAIVDRHLSSVRSQRDRAALAADHVFSIHAAGRFNVAVDEKIARRRRHGETATVAAEEIGPGAPLPPFEGSAMIFPGATAKSNAGLTKGQAASISTRSGRRVRSGEVQEYAIWDEVGEDDSSCVVVDLE